MTHGQYDPLFVALSVVIAMFAGYTALDLASSVLTARGRGRAAWLAGGSVAMGTGIWSMHFVGMLAFRVPGVPISYFVPLLILSILVAIAASALALFAVSRPRIVLATLVAAGLAMGAAICGMHYIGVASMRLAARVEWNGLLVAASIAIAVLASFVALWLAFRFRRESGRRAVIDRLAGGVVMGVAISGMHYTAMAAMGFLPIDVPVPVSHENVLATNGLAVAVTVTTLLILGIALTGTVVQRALTRRSVMAVEAERRARDEAALHEIASALAGASTVQEVAQRVVDSGLQKRHALGATIERVEPDGSGEVEIMASAGKSVPEPGRRVPFAGSLSEAVIARERWLRPTRLETMGETVAPYLRSLCRDCPGIIVPLSTDNHVLGVLALVRGPGEEPYESSDLAFAGALGDMASAALSRVLLLQQLTESERRFRELAENLREIFWVLDPLTRTLLYVSPAYEAVVGRPRVSPTEDTRAWLDAIHAEDRRRVDMAIDALVRREHEFEYRLVRPDSGMRWIHARGLPIRDEQGVILRIVGLSEDITERKTLEERQRLLAEAGRILAFSIDYEETLGNVARIAVPELADWCAISLREESGALRIREVAHADPGKARLAWKFHESFPADPKAPVPLYDVFRTGMPELVREIDESWMERVSESPEHLAMLRTLGPGSLIVVPLVARGRTIGMIWLAHAVSGRQYDADDLSVAEELARRAAAAIDHSLLHQETMVARREAERRAQQETELRIELERVTESRARLVRGFSHDVREPLSVADGYLSLLEEEIDERLSEKQKEMVQNGRRAIRRAVSLTSDLLDLARAEAGQIEIERAPTQLAQAAFEVAEEYRAAAEAKGLVINIDPPSDFPVIDSDPVRVRQILGNLVSNAVKYSANGSVAIGVEVCQDGDAPEPGRWAAVRVTDTGPGLTPEQMNRLFEEFTRLETARETTGAGIGLAISRTLARVLGGDITVVSEIGQGSTFTLWLPLDQGTESRAPRVRRR